MRADFTVSLAKFYRTAIGSGRPARGLRVRRIVEPYEVRSWYKMGETGEVKAILEPAEGWADYGRAVA